MSDVNKQLCPFCGAENSFSASFCPICGKKIKVAAVITPLIASYPPPPPPPASAKTRSRSSRKILLGVIVGVIAVVLVVGALTMFAPNNGSNQLNPTATASPTATPPSPTATAMPTTPPTSTPPPTVTPNLVITGINVQIQYAGSDQGFFGAESQTVSLSNQPSGYLSVQPGQQFFLYFTMKAPTSGTSSDSIAQVSVGTPGFTLVSVQPQTPIAFSTGASTQITVTLQAPQTSYNGPIQLILTTSG